MGINFPSSPLVGDLWPNPVVAGQGQYTWDGEKWTSGTVNTVGAVRYDTPQTLTDDVGTTNGQKTQARSNIYAAPFDAMAYNGMQINGSVASDQEALGNRSISGGAWLYISDMWAAQAGGAVQVIGSQNNAGTPPAGFPKYARIYIATAAATLAAGDYAILETLIEGYRAERLLWGAANAQPVTIGFWVGVPVSGTMAVTIMNNATNRSYVASVNVVAGWQYKTVTIPGDQIGTWEKTNLRGVRVIFCFGGGASVRGAADTWQGVFAYSSNLTTNFLGTAGVECAVTGVVILPGIEVPSATRSPYIMRPFDQELAACKRYWYKAQVGLQTIAANGGYYSVAWMHPVEMRTTPTITFSGNISGSGFNTPLAEQATQYGFRCTAQANAAGQGGFQAVYLVDARLV